MATLGPYRFWLGRSGDVSRWIELLQGLLDRRYLGTLPVLAGSVWYISMDGFKSMAQLCAA